MSTLIYNRVGLIRCQELEFIRQPQYQGPDYIWTYYKLVVRGVFNPEVNAYNFSGGASAAQIPNAVLGDPTFAVPVNRPVPGARRLALIASAGVVGAPVPVGPALMTEGAEAPLTDLAVRHQLSQPRFALFYAVGNTPVLVSPALNQDGTEAATDANNGPFPVVIDLVQISGTKTFLVDFGIETYVNEAMCFANTASVLLSHRWSASETADQDYFLTRVVEGRAQFRTDRLALLAANPDNFRGSLFHALPGPGWKRVDVQVHAPEDGSSLEYRITDKQLALSIIPAFVTRIEAFQTVDSTTLAAEGVVKGAGRTVLDTLTGIGKGMTEAFRDATARFGTNPFFSITGSLTGMTAAAMPGFMASSIGNFAKNIPLLNVVIVVRVWGQENTTRKVLEGVAIDIVLTRFGLALNLAALFTAETAMSIQHDLAGKFVEVIASKKTALSRASINLTSVPFLTILPDIRSSFPATDDTLGTLTTTHTMVTPLGLPLRPNAIGTGTRGTFIEQLATAALLNADAVPQSPPAVFPAGVAVIDRTPP